MLGPDQIGAEAMLRLQIFRQRMSARPSSHPPRRQRKSTPSAKARTCGGGGVASEMRLSGGVTHPEHKHPGRQHRTHDLYDEGQHDHEKTPERMADENGPARRAQKIGDAGLYTGSNIEAYDPRFAGQVSGRPDRDGSASPAQPTPTSSPTTCSTEMPVIASATPTPQPPRFRLRIRGAKIGPTAEFSFIRKLSCRPTWLTLREMTH